MAVTKEVIAQRKTMLERQRDQLMANINAVMGAIQNCDEILKDWDVEKKETEIVQTATSSPTTFAVVEDSKEKPPGDTPQSS